MERDMSEQKIKICKGKNGCGKPKSYGEFSTYSNLCKQCMSTYQRNRYLLKKLNQPKIDPSSPDFDLFSNRKREVYRDMFTDIFLALYNDNNISIDLIAHVLKMNLTSVYNKVYALKNEGYEITRRSDTDDLKLSSTDLIGSKLQYDLRNVKKRVEQEAIASVHSNGGFFGLAGRQIRHHWEMFGHIVSDKFPFLAIDHSPLNCKHMIEVANDIRNEDESANIRIRKGFLFDQLKKEKIKNGPRFCYGHLDFCSTARIMFRDHNLGEDLEWLASWNNLMDTSYMDVTFATRNGHKSHIKAMEETIPQIFINAGWKVSGLPDEQTDTGLKYIRTYFETTKESGNRGSIMANAFYKLERRTV